MFLLGSTQAYQFVGIYVKGLFKAVQEHNGKSLAQGGLGREISLQGKGL
jgi:hypothetical protein